MSIYNPILSPIYSAIRSPISRKRGAGLPGTYYDWTGASLPSPWDTLRRAGLGTRVGPDGLVGFGPHNTALWSEDLTQTSRWNHFDASVSGNSIVAPDGTLTADKIVENTANAAHRVFNDRVVADTTQPFEVWAIVQAAGRTEVAFGVGNGRFTYSIVNLTTGVPGALAGIEAANCSIATESIGSGWWKLKFAGRFSATDTGHCWLWMTSAGNLSYTGNGVDGIAVWRMSVRQTPAPEIYVPTTTAPVYLPRPTHNPSTLAALGILFEGQATNLVGATESFNNAYWLLSEMTVSANAATGPDGQSTADRVIPTAVLGTKLLYVSGVAISSGVTYTQSVWLKAAGRTRVGVAIQAGSAWFGKYVDLSNGAVGADYIGAPSAFSVTPHLDGWYRVSISGLSNGTALQWRILVTDAGGGTITGNGVDGVLVWGAQLETGTVATSYIPNPTTGTALRTGDFAGGGITGAALTALLTPTAPFTIVLPFRKSYSLASVETLLGLCAGASAGTTNQLGIATQGTQAQLVHSGGSGALTGTLVLDGSTVNKVAVSVDPTARGAELFTALTATNANSTINQSSLPTTVTCVNPGTFGARQNGVITAGNVGRSFAVTVSWSGNNEGRLLYCDLGDRTGTLGSAASGTMTFLLTPTAIGALIVYGLSGAIGNDFTVQALSVREAGAMSISVNGSAVTETTGIAYTGAGTTAAILGARDSSGGQPATGFTSPGIRVAAGQYITGAALQALSVP
jgi:hypothetical protein